MKAKTISALKANRSVFRHLSLSTVSLGFALAAFTQAATIAVTSLNPDGILQNANAVDTGEGEPVVGRFSGNLSRVVIYPFLLPTLPVGEVLSTVSLNVAFRGLVGGTPNFNVDLYAVGVNTSNDIAQGGGAFWGVGDTPTTPAGSVLIQNDFVIPSTATGTLTTNAGASTNLVTYLNANYVAGRFLFLRLNFDVDQGAETNAYRFGANNFGNSSQDFDSTSVGSIPAVLTLTTIPEPSSLGLLGLGGLLMLRRSRRQQSRQTPAIS